MGYISPFSYIKICNHCGAEFKIGYYDWYLKEPKICHKCRESLGIRDKSLDGIFLLMGICFSALVAGALYMFLMI